MTKHFCDICETQIGRNAVTDRFRPTMYRRYKNWSAEVMICKGTVWNSGDLCMDCLRELLASDQEARSRFGGIPPYAGNTP